MLWFGVTILEDEDPFPVVLSQDVHGPFKDLEALNESLGDICAEINDAGYQCVCFPFETLDEDVPEVINLE